MILIFLLQQFTNVNSQFSSQDSNDNQQSNTYNMSVAIYLAIATLMLINFRIPVKLSRFYPDTNNISARESIPKSDDKQSSMAALDNDITLLCKQIYQQLNMSETNSFFRIESIKDGKIKFFLPLNAELLTFMNALVTKLVNNNEEIKVSYERRKDNTDPVVRKIQPLAYIFDLSNLEQEKFNKISNEIIIFIKQNSMNISTLVKIANNIEEKSESHSSQFTI